MSRQCGECRACCFTHKVQEIGKANRQHCQHECAAGCAIYATRPQSCRDFQCLWLQGRFETGDRPDQIGIVLTPSAPMHHNGHEVCKVMQAHELRPGAARQGRAIEVINWMLKRNTSVIIVGETNTPRSLIPCSEAALEAYRARHG